jgi:hypothetical protein
MLKSTTSPSNANNDENNYYKKCLGKDCTNDGTYFMSCSIICKIGLFCDSCRMDLEESGLVDSTNEKGPYQTDLLRWMQY